MDAALIEQFTEQYHRDPPPNMSLDRYLDINVPTHVRYHQQIMNKLKPSLCSLADSIPTSPSPAPAEQSDDGIFGGLPVELLLQTQSELPYNNIPVPVVGRTAAIHTARMTNHAFKFNHRFYTRSVEFFYKNNIFTVSYAKNPKGEYYLHSPPPAYSHLVRHVVADFHVEISDNPAYRLLEGRTDWRWLLRMNPDAERMPLEWKDATFSDAARLGYSQMRFLHYRGKHGSHLGFWNPGPSTAWQDRCTKLKTLKVVLTADNCMGDTGPGIRCLAVRAEKYVGGLNKELLKTWFERLLGDSHISAKAEKVEVEIKGMDQCEGHWCEGVCKEVVEEVVGGLMGVGKE
ncbi:hypothetical protein P280DRAFT_484338 [Massarina eburnea CBS 473.64]|uniref:Uncharacterized protein n=1 Tax=Massarina eburnea CBS 473.64 TaxID=1395130 RepID=A0A6A6RMA4_9PLEO|nr:hypothetical protein P280DRAFT_484338 [Massarina eburnea CBS 473.64]